MKVAVVNQKGGTGKTTTAVNLGVALANSGKQVLLIDLDPQGNLSYSLGIDPDAPSLSDVLQGDAEMQNIIYEQGNVSIIPSNVSLADVELTLAGVDEREAVLATALGGLADNYDYVFIDCPPSLSLLTLNALTYAESVIIPLQMTVLSIQGLGQILDTIKLVKESINSAISVMGVLPVMVDKRRKLSEEVKEHILDNYDVRIFDSGIRNNVRAAEAPSFGVSVIEYSPKSNSALDYLDFAQEILTINKA